MNRTNATYEPQLIPAHGGYRNLKSYQGIANDYGSLGLIGQTRGEHAQAREYWDEASVLFQKIGARDRMQTVQTWIDDLPKDGH